MPALSAPLLLSIAEIVLMSAGSGGAPLSCKHNKLCLTDFNNENFHRLTVTCPNFTADLGKNGDAIGRGAFYDGDSHCITRPSGDLLQCTVKETDHSGFKKTLHFTYNCTPEFDTSTSPALIPGGLTLTTSSTAPSSGDDNRQHHWVIAAAFVFLFLLVLLVCWICHLIGCQIFLGDTGNHKQPSIPGNLKKPNHS